MRIQAVLGPRRITTFLLVILAAMSTQALAHTPLCVERYFIHPDHGHADFIVAGDDKWFLSSQFRPQITVPMRSHLHCAGIRCARFRRRPRLQN